MVILDRARKRGGKTEDESGMCSPCRACEIRDLSVCDVLSAEEQNKLGAILTQIRVEAQQTVFYEGDSADYVYNVTEGCVRVSKMLVDGRRQITGFLFPGDFLGLAFNDIYAYTAESVNGARFCRFPRKKLEDLFVDLPHLEKRLLSVAATELVAAQDQMLLLGRKSAREKICSFLLTLAERATKRGDPPNPVRLPMSRSDIADYLGLTIETVSRTFTRMAKEGLILLPASDTVRILRREVVTDLASGDGD